MYYYNIAFTTAWESFALRQLDFEPFVISYTSSSIISSSNWGWSRFLRIVLLPVSVSCSSPLSS